MPHIVQKLEKVVVNAGIGKLSNQPGFTDKLMPDLMRDFGLITGQKPKTAPAKKSISGFKLREGTVVGLTATLRGKRMADFLNRFVKVVLPRIRDFRGINLSSVDGQGNLSIGIRESVVFPEVNPEISKASFGVQVTVVPRNIKSKEDAMALYRAIGLPLKKA